MPRFARIVVKSVPHHITQRGNNEQDVFLLTMQYQWSSAAAHVGQDGTTKIVDLNRWNEMSGKRDWKSFLKKDEFEN